MSILEAIILGIVQGLTEFLPVSSSGHLELGKYLLNNTQVGEQSMLMTVMLHGATALSTVFIFWKDILHILKGLFQFKWNEEWQFASKIVLSMIPAVIIGLAFEEQLESLFDRRIGLVGAFLILTALLLLLADRAKNSQQKVGFFSAILIGIAQAIAILPGISRSGATISTSVLLGIDRTKAARFSFLMVLPLIFGKIAKDVLSGDIHYDSDIFLPLLAGFIAAFLTGLFACRLMIKIVQNSQLFYFAIYCLVIGCLAMYFAWAS